MWEGCCEKIGNYWKARREGAAPPMIRNELRARWRPGALADRIFFTASGCFRQTTVPGPEGRW